MSALPLSRVPYQPQLLPAIAYHCTVIRPLTVSVTMVGPKRTAIDQVASHFDQVCQRVPILRRNRSRKARATEIHMYSARRNETTRHPALLCFKFESREIGMETFVGRTIQSNTRQDRRLSKIPFPAGTPEPEFVLCGCGIHPRDSS